MPRRLLESLSGVGTIHAGELLLRTTAYELSVWAHDDQPRPAGEVARSFATVDGYIEIGGIAEAVVLAGPGNLTLTLEDGRRLAFELTGSGGGIVGRGWLQYASAPERASGTPIGSGKKMPTAAFDTRLAGPTDADDIAVAHRDSIRSIGPAFYPPDVVDDWSAGLTRDIYLRAMADGEVFFVAIGEIEGTSTVLGFSSHRIDGGQHGVSVYMRGIAARQGIGSALFRLAEADALGAGATSIQVESSLAAVEFYKANGFEELARGEVRLQSGRLIACVFMRKDPRRDISRNALA